MRCLWQVEIDDEQCEHSNGIGPAYCDDATCTTVVHNLPGLMLLVADLACTDISNAGPRTDLRGGAAVVPGEYARIVRELRPRYILVENVCSA